MLSIPVQIEITTTIQQGEEVEDLLESSEGKLYGEAGRFFLQYHTRGEGDDEEVTTIIKLESNQVTIMRHGLVTMRHRFIPGEMDTSWYTTSLGRLEMKTLTTRLEYETTLPTSLIQALYLSYQLWLSGQEVGAFQLSILVKPLSSSPQLQ